MMLKKLLNDESLGVNIAISPPKIVRKYAIQRFDKKNDRKRNEPKSCKLTVCYGQKNWR